MGTHPDRVRLDGFSPDEPDGFDAWIDSQAAPLMASLCQIRDQATREAATAEAQALLDECQGESGFEFLHEHYSGQQSLAAWLELCARRRAISRTRRTGDDDEDVVTAAYLDRLRSGDPATWADFKPRAERWLARRLFKQAQDSRTREAAQGVIDDLLSDLILKGLLAKFHGTGSFQGWLCRIAERRLLDVLKSSRFKVETSMPHDEQGESLMDTLCAAPAASEIDPVVLETLKEGLTHAFKRLPAKDLFIIRLVKLHGVEQQVLARLLEVDPGTISKCISRATASVSSQLASFMRSVDPDGDLDLSDYVGLAEHFRAALHGAE